MTKYTDCCCNIEGHAHDEECECREKIRELEAEVGLCHSRELTFKARAEKAEWALAERNAMLDKAEADVKWIRSQPIVIENVHLKARVAVLEKAKCDHCGEPWYEFDEYEPRERDRDEMTPDAKAAACPLGLGHLGDGPEHDKRIRELETELDRRFGTWYSPEVFLQMKARAEKAEARVAREREG